MTRIICKAKRQKLPSGVLILGEPVPAISRREVNDEFSLDRLTDKTFYDSEIKPLIVEDALNELISVSKHPYLPLHRQCLVDFNIITVHTSTTRNESTGSDFVYYRSAIQFYHPVEGRVFGGLANTPLLYDEGKKDLVKTDESYMDSSARQLRGTAVVAYVAAQVDITDYFKPPFQIEEFDGSIDGNPMARELYEQFLKERLLVNIRNLEAEGGVKFILLSKLMVKRWSTELMVNAGLNSGTGYSHQTENGFLLSLMEPKSEIMVAVTYFI